MPEKPNAPDRLELAKQILAHSRRLLTRDIPALLPAVYQMDEEPVDIPGPLSSNGYTIFFCPDRVLADFRMRKDEVARQLLHLVCHGLLGHFSQREGQTEAVFDPAADAKVYQWMRLLGQAAGRSYVPARRTLTAEGRALAQAAGKQSLQALYLHHVSTPELAREAAAAADCLALDDHGVWRRPSRASQMAAGEAGNGGDALSKLWQNLRRQAAQAMAGSPRWGNAAGTLTGNYEPAEENNISYRDFLTRFANLRERQQMDPDSFDRTWYHLGLTLYGDMPLVEYDELREEPVADDLVIALDTSGSCAGDTMRAFLRETLNLLRDITRGSSRFTVHLIQCDAEIQKECTLTTPEEVDGLLENFQPSGFGGTDFRPVFRRVEELRAGGTLPRVRGLIYLTDGFGDYPDTPPDYPVALLFPPEELPFEEARKDIVPAWVTSLQLTEHDLLISKGDAT